MIQETDVKVAKLSVVALVLRLILDVILMCILVGFVLFIKDLIDYFTTHLKITCIYVNDVKQTFIKKFALSNII